MRRQRRQRNKRDILIDLTSLLDVVFIFLMVVLYNQQNETREAQAKNIEASEIMEQAKVQLELYTDQMDSVDNLCLVSVYARYEPDNITQRHLSIQKKGEEIEEIELIGNNTKEAFDTLQSSLRAYIELNKEKPVILSLNEKDENILYRDEKEILIIFDKLKHELNNVYIK